MCASIGRSVFVAELAKHKRLSLYEHVFLLGWIDEMDKSYVLRCSRLRDGSLDREIRLSYR